MLLDIEARIGELYASLPDKSRGADRAHGKVAAIKEGGLDRFRAHAAETIHRNPAAVAAGSVLGAVSVHPPSEAAPSFSESPEIVYGRLLESVHVSGYTMERACVGLEYLLEDDKWKSVGIGFEDIDDFQKSIDLSQFKIAVDRRKKLVKRLDDLQATQRATAKALGVSHQTTMRDLGPSGPKPSQKPREIAVESTPTGPSGPTPLSTSGMDAGGAVPSAGGAEQSRGKNRPCTESDMVRLLARDRTSPTNRP